MKMNPEQKYFDNQRRKQCLYGEENWSVVVSKAARQVYKWAEMGIN